MGAYEKHLARPDANGIVYVDSSNTAVFGDGSSWTKAVSELADALKEAKTNTDIKEIWAAKGTYKPVYNADDAYLNSICHTTDRDASFVLVPGVKLYGGFAGGEADTIGRDFVFNRTILSGDFSNNDVITGTGSTLSITNNTENTYHVVISSGGVGDAELGGFSVRSGNANFNSDFTVNGLAIGRYAGGGMANYHSSPTITNCIFAGNSTKYYLGGGMANYSSSPTITNSAFTHNSAESNGLGGGMYNSTNSSPTITNCSFTGNLGDFRGGGMYNSNSSPTIANSSFSGNSSDESGGGMYNSNSSPTITNSIFMGNSANYGGGILNVFSSSPNIINSTIAGNKGPVTGGGIYNSSSMGAAILKNCVVFGNSTNISGFPATVSNSIIGGGYTGTNVIDADPLFVSPHPPTAAPTILGNYRLQPCSPAINMGDNSLIPPGLTKDLDRLERIKYTTVDIGAYELQIIDLANTTWKGVNTNWNDKINWCGGYIPADTTNVIVPVTSNNPLINAGYENGVKNISFANNTSIGIANTGKFTINGSYTNNGSTITNNGTWVMAGNVAGQTFPGALATVSIMKNLEIDNSSGIKFEKSFELTGTLTPRAGNINVDNATITLNSDATATARVASVSSGVAFSYTGMGKFEVERFIPPHRAWRLLTAPLNTATNLTISQAWQEGLSNANRLSPVIGTPGFGTTITKSTTYNVADGYDEGSTNNPSIRYYNGANWGGFPSSTIGTTPGANDGLINDKQGYMLFVRGDRSIQVAGAGVTATVTTLRPKGQLKVGHQTITCTGWTVIGNPYASPINFHKIVLDNPGLPDVFYVWDANLAGSSNVGGWVSYGSYDGGTQTYTVAPLLSGSTFANNKGDISSGSAFMVNYTGSIIINETAKSTLGDNVLYRPTSKLSMNLYVVNADSTESLNDGLVIKMDASPRAANAEKNKNFTENFAIAFENKLYAIQNRRRPHFNDTVFISTGQMKQRNYVLEIKADELNMTHSMKAYLEDTYLHQYKAVALEGSTRYAFTVNTDSGSISAARFRLLFKKAARFSSIIATAKEKDIEVQWEMEEVFGIEQYEIERSINGIDFMLIGNHSTHRNQQPLMQNQWLDVSPAIGTYYYRIKATGIDGEVLYSDIAKASMVKNNTGMYICPNPVTNGLINLRLNEMPAGRYTARLVNAAGQVILTQQWGHQGGFITKQFVVNATGGIYQLEVTNTAGKTTLQVEILNN